ncbi:MAG: PhoH family protein [Candidatus Fermentibacteraceae bacterium]
MEDSISRKLPLPVEEARKLLGPGDIHLREICRAMNVAAVYRDGRLVFTGGKTDVDRALATVDRLRHELRVSGKINDHSIRKALDFPAPHDAELEIKVPGRAGRIIPKTPGQERYLRAMDDTDVVFSIGPAGTGKTYLAVGKAVSDLREGAVERIVITRPAVEAGENLGFLPGDLRQKIDPYLRPIYDALNDTLSPARVKRSIENGIIEVAPLAYMRGRTLNNAFVVLDEAQNTTLTQLKMFLTRLGYRSRAVITGDITQVDLRPSASSGLIRIQNVLRGVFGVEFVYLDSNDVVRHPLVQRIISAFHRASEREGEEP